MCRCCARANSWPMTGGGRWRLPLASAQSRAALATAGRSGPPTSWGAELRKPWLSAEGLGGAGLHGPTFRNNGAEADGRWTIGLTWVISALPLEWRSLMN